MSKLGMLRRLPEVKADDEPSVLLPSVPATICIPQSDGSWVSFPARIGPDLDDIVQRLEMMRAEIGEMEDDVVYDDDDDTGSDWLESVVNDVALALDQAIHVIDDKQNQ